MTRKKAKVEREIGKTVKDLTDQRSEILTRFAEAYMIERGVLPSQVKLVEKQELGYVSWHFALRDPDPFFLKKYWYQIKFHLRTVKIALSKYFTKPCL